MFYAIAVYFRWVSCDRTVREIDSAIADTIHNSDRSLLLKLEFLRSHIQFQNSDHTINPKSNCDLFN
jgi:hypothetical protein